MSLTFKKQYSNNLQNISVLVEDMTPTSPDYFRVSNVPTILQQGKNYMSIELHPTNLVVGSEVKVDVRDAKGEKIYHEIPDYLGTTNERFITFWIYHDKGDDNPTNGMGTITLVGEATVDGNGNPLPKNASNRLVRWAKSVMVDRDAPNTSQIIFNSTEVPTIVVSESIEIYKDIPQGNGLPTKTTTTGTDAKYIFKGSTPVVQTSTSTPFNQEMVGGTVFLHSFTNPATPTTSISNPTNITSYTSSIVEVIDTQTAKLQSPFTTTFDNRTKLIHTFSDIAIASYKIEHFSTGSYTTSDSKRAFANITISGSDPIVGVVAKAQVSLKSVGSPSDEYEVLNTVSVPYSSSYELKLPIPTEHLGDVQNIKVQYLNSIGNISPTETISDDIAFTGNKDRVEGTLGGFAITATAISSSFNLSDGTPALDLGISGSISGSAMLIRQTYEGNTYAFLDTTNGVVDAKNIGRQLVSDSTEYASGLNEDDNANFNVKTYYPVTFLNEETHIGISFQAKAAFPNDSAGTGTIRFSIATPVGSSSFGSTTVDYYDSWNSNATDIDYALGVKSSETYKSISMGTSGSSLVEIPDSAKGKFCKIILSINNNWTGGSLVQGQTKAKNISIYACRHFAGAAMSDIISGSVVPDSIDDTRADYSG